MSEARSAASRANFSAAFRQLEEAATWPDDVRSRDATILRFLLVYETAWEALRHALADQGIEASTPRAAFKAAYAAGWLEDEAVWLAMLEDRNLVAHTYREAMAERVRSDIEAYLPPLRALLGHLDSLATG